MTLEQTAKVISFPSEQRSKRTRKSGERIRSVDGIKYFNEKQIKMIRRAVRDQADIDIKKGQVTAVREWMVIDLLTCTGVRVSEAANLCCGDLKIGYADSKIFIREGKGHVSGHVVINDAVKKHLKAFIAWKQQQGEQTGEDDHLFVGQRGAWTSQAIQQIVKKYLKKLDLYEKGKAVYALRHSYAVELYSKDKDLRVVQKQLRHVSIQSTLVYADVTDEAIGSQIRGLWN
jgi:site-specific recombinase XerD